MNRFAQENQTWSARPSSWNRIGGWIVLGLLVVALAACQPGGASTTSTSSTATTPAHPAPVHVPPGYQGFIEVTFSATTTYAQALAVLQHAGLQAEAQCAGPGAPVDSPPRPTQQPTFDQTHQLSAVGMPRLTTTMLTQAASAPQVVSIGIAPKVFCPV
jgi:hypothetical protein